MASPSLTLFFFLKGGMNISVPAVVDNVRLVALLLGVKLVPKIAGVYPLARRSVPRDAWYTTLLTSTGLIFGIISSHYYGLNASIINQTQFSVLVTVVVIMAVLPALVNHRWFTPPSPTTDEVGRRGVFGVARHTSRLKRLSQLQQPEEVGYHH